MSHEEQLDRAESLAARSRRSDKRWKIGLLLLVLVLLLGGSAATALAVTSQQLAQAEANQRQALARAVADACSGGRPVFQDSVNLCDRAADLAAEPVLIPGPPVLIPGPPPARFTFTADGRPYLCIPDPPGSATFTCSAG